MVRKLFVVGAGKGADLVIRYFQELPSWCLECRVPFSIEGVFDDNKTGDCLGVPILGKVSLVDSLPDGTLHIEDDMVVVDETVSLCISSSNMKFRRQVYGAHRKRFFFEGVLRSRPKGYIGQGNLIFPRVTMDWFSTIGDNNVISTGAVINHHCHVGNGNLFGPGCMLSGSVTVGNNCLFGSGVIVEPCVTIGDDVHVASGTIIVSDVPSGTTIKADRKIDRLCVYQGERRVR